MRKLLSSWRADKSGATAIEYALIAAAISLAITFFIFQFGGELSDFFDVLVQALITGMA